MDDSTDIRIAKDRLRHEMRARRRTMSPDLVATYSASIRRQLEAMPSFQAAKTISLYIPFDNEVDTLPLLTTWQGKKRIVATRITAQNSLELRTISSLDDLEKGSFGVMEAKTSCPLVPPDEVDLIIIPGLAFDRHGNRLGFGAGHFDRLLAHTNATLVGLAYRFQVIDSIPQECHDIRMHHIVSEDTLGV